MKKLLQRYKALTGEMTMDKQTIKTKWLEELRSGNHHQIQGTLKDQFGNGEYGYCCLGVLAEKVMGLEVRIMDGDAPNDVGDTGIYEKIGNTIGQYFSDECSRKNDTGWTFEKIADLIEKDWVV